MQYLFIGDLTKTMRNFPNEDEYYTTLFSSTCENTIFSAEVVGVCFTEQPHPKPDKNISK